MPGRAVWRAALVSSSSRLVLRTFDHATVRLFEPSRAALTRASNISHSWLPGSFDRLTQLEMLPIQHADVWVPRHSKPRRLEALSSRLLAVPDTPMSRDNRIDYRLEEGTTRLTKQSEPPWVTLTRQQVPLSLECLGRHGEQEVRGPDDRKRLLFRFLSPN